MQFTSFLGLRNDVSWERQDPIALGKDDNPKHYLDSAINIVLDNTGRPSRRDGLVEVIAGSSHSIWSDGTVCFFAQGATLYRLLPDDSTETIRTDLSGEPLSYHEVAGTVYYSDGTIAGMYSESLGSQDWGVREPTPLDVTVISGELPAGTYSYTATYTDRTGREGGAVAFGTMLLTEQGGLQFALPELDDETAITIYVTPTNGDTYYELTTVTGGSAALYVDQNSLILPLYTAHKMKPRAGGIVSNYRGHMLIASGAWIFYSDPYHHHLFDNLNYLPFDSEVTIVAPVADGIFVATRNKTYFLAGSSPKDFILRTVAKHGAIKGTLTYVESSDIGGLEKIPSHPMAIWSSEAGICAGGNEGLFINLTESRYKFDEVNDRGASVLMNMGDSKQFITSIL